MNDPHVDKLHYKVSSGEGISYDDPDPLSDSNELGTFELREGRLSFELVDVFAEVDDARSAIEPFLKSWEIEADLRSGIGSIRFTFERADVIDRDPPPPGKIITLKVNIRGKVTTSDQVNLHIARHEYPAPPSTFRSTPDVEICHLRWSRNKEGREHLLSMAYFVLTQIEKHGGTRQKRKRAASILQIDEDVLDKIGHLTAERGNASTARKAQPDNTYQELSGSEKIWLEKAVRQVILRLGEHASGKPLTQITMNDLPAS